MVIVGNDANYHRRRRRRQHRVASGKQAHCPSNHGNTQQIHSGAGLDEMDRLGEVGEDFRTDSAEKKANAVLGFEADFVFFGRNGDTEAWAERQSRGQNEEEAGAGFSGACI